MAESTSTRDFAKDGMESTSIIDFAEEGLGKAPAAAEWEKHRATIDAIYLGKNFTINAMMDVMKEEHGFDQSLDDYRHFIVAWGLSFKNLTAREIAALGLVRRVRERLHPKKRTVYSVRNRHIDIERLEVYLKEYRPFLAPVLGLTEPELNISAIHPQAVKIRCSTPAPNASHEFIVPPVRSTDELPAGPVSKAGDDAGEGSVQSNIRQSIETEEDW